MDARKLLVVLALGSLAMPASAQLTEIFKCRDARGHWTLYERPAPGREGEVRAGGEPDQRQPGAQRRRGLRPRTSRANRAPSAPPARGASARSCSRSSPARKPRSPRRGRRLPSRRRCAAATRRNYARVARAPEAVQGQRREPPEEHRSAEARARQPVAAEVLAGPAANGPATFAGLDLLATAVVMLDDEFVVRYANPAAENLLDAGARSLIGQPFLGLFAERTIWSARSTRRASSTGTIARRRELRAHRPRAGAAVLRRRAASTLSACGCWSSCGRSSSSCAWSARSACNRAAEANRELIRNLAHEIKNPLGGLRGSAQLLERELDRAELREYTQVIIKEADRLQALMDRLLTPHRAPRVEPHEHARGARARAQPGARGIPAASTIAARLRPERARADGRTASS